MDFNTSETIMHRLKIKTKNPPNILKNNSGANNDMSQSDVGNKAERWRQITAGWNTVFKVRKM